MRVTFAREMLAAARRRAARAGDRRRAAGAHPRRARAVPGPDRDAASSRCRSRRDWPGAEVDIEIAPGYEVERAAARRPTASPSSWPTCPTRPSTRESIVATFRLATRRTALPSAARSPRRLPPGAVDALRPTTSSDAPEAFDRCRCRRAVPIEAASWSAATGARQDSPRPPLIRGSILPRSAPRFAHRQATSMNSR